MLFPITIHKNVFIEFNFFFLLLLSLCYLDNNPTKLTIHSDHTHIFDTVHVDTCDETCAIEDIVGTVTLDVNEIDSGCNLEQCGMFLIRKRIFIFIFVFKAPINHEYVLIPKDIDYNQVPQSNFISFDDTNQASIVHKKDFTGQLNDDFIIQMWMKHSDQEVDEKEHVFCKSDEKCKEILFFFKNEKKMFCFFFFSSNESSSYSFIYSKWLFKIINT